MSWNSKHCEILKSIFLQLNRARIKFFVIRNYKGLPEINESKDVDIVVKHGSAMYAENILKKVFKESGLKYYYRVQIEESLLCRAVSKDGNFAIHIDLMNGYINRGVEIIPFDTLYNHTVEYNGFRVLDELFNGIMLFIYKQFGYKKPFLKQSYQDEIHRVWKKYPEFSSILSDMIGEKLYLQISEGIKEKDFNQVLSFSREIDKKLRLYSYKHNYLINKYRKFLFVCRKTDRVIFRYRKFEKSFSVMAPDGTGKTTFLEALLNRLAWIYVDTPKEKTRFHVYHFRPQLIPNLGALGEKTGIFIQDTDFSNPHRAKSAGFLSSLFRITYYWFDYVVGWMYYTRKDVQYDHYSVYDRYSYDLLVDPKRTRLNLPSWIRKLYVNCMPHPKLNFYLKADPYIIAQRKAELSLPEIQRQLEAYDLLAPKKGNICILNANQEVNAIVEKAITYILEMYWEKL